MKYKEDEKICTVRVVPPVTYKRTDTIVQCRSLEGHTHPHWAGEFEHPIRWVMAGRSGIPDFYCHSQHSRSPFPASPDLQDCCKVYGHDGLHVSEAGHDWVDGPTFSQTHVGSPINISFEELLMSPQEVRENFGLSEDQVAAEVAGQLGTKKPRTRTERKKRRR